MQPQSEKNIIQRFLEWWKARPGGDSRSRSSTSRGTSETPVGEPDSGSSTSGTGDSIASNPGGASGTLHDRLTDLAGTINDKVEEPASDAGRTASAFHDQAMDAPDTLGASNIGSSPRSAGNTDDTVRLNDLTSSHSGSSTRDAENASQRSSVPGGSEGMRSLYQGSKSTSGASESPPVDAGATDFDASNASDRDIYGRNASPGTAGSGDDKGGTAGAQPNLDRSDSSFTPDAGSGGDSDQQASAGAAVDDRQDDLSGTAHDRRDAGATFRDLSAADSLATGSFADEDVRDRPDPDLQGIGDLRAEDLGTLEDIEIESTQQESGDVLGTWSPSDTNAENDRSELAGLVGNEPDASINGADQPEDILVVEEDVIILGWSTDAGSALETPGDVGSPSDSAKSDTAEEDTVGISGMPGTSTASGMPDAAESSLVSEDESGNSADSETNATQSSDEQGTLTADEGRASDAINSSSTGAAGSAEDLASESTGEGSNEHFGFLGYDNAATTDLGYLNQATARRFDFGSGTSTNAQGDKPAATTSIPAQRAVKTGDDTSGSQRTADAGGVSGTSDQARSTTSDTAPSDTTSGGQTGGDTESKPLSSGQRSTSTDETSAQPPAYVLGSSGPKTSHSATAPHTTTPDDTTAGTRVVAGSPSASDVAGVSDAGQTRHPSAPAGGTKDASRQGMTSSATTGTQMQSEQTGPGGSIRGDKSGSCPADHPIKGNGSSKIYHMPGISSYRGTKAEFCFATEAGAIAAGFRAPGQRNHGGGTTASASSGEESSAPSGATGSAASGKTGSSMSKSDTVADTDTHMDCAVPPASTSEDSAAQSQSSDASEGAARAGGSAAGHTASSGANDDQFGSGADDIESLQRQSPDDIESGRSTRNSAGTTVTSEEGHSDQHAKSGIAGGERHIAGAVRGDGSHSCPAEYPIKGNAGSMIYHSPGRSSYDATIAEWCFATEEDALKAGFRAPKR